MAEAVTLMCDKDRSGLIDKKEFMAASVGLVEHALDILEKMDE